MEDMASSIRRVNLNLLPILLEILRTRNITQAARSLCLTQSATSGCLKRLREIFNDELLTRRGRDMVLTEKAKALLPRLEAFLAQAVDVIDTPVFNPATDTVRFRIATADWIGALPITRMNAFLAEAAPNITLEFLDANLPSVASDLKKGFADLLIGPKEVLEWANLNAHDADSDYLFAHCFDDELVAMMSTADACPEVKTDREAYLAHPHVTFNLNPRMHASLERLALNESRLTQHDRYLVAQFGILPYLVATTGAIAVVPSSLAEQFAALLPITTFKPPLELRKVHMVMVWSKARQHEQSLRWLCGVIPEVFSASRRFGKDSAPKRTPGKRRAARV